MTIEEALEILDTIPTIHEQVDALEVAIDTMHKYQKIQEIVDGVDTLANPFGYSSRDAIDKIRDVLGKRY